MRSIFIAKHKRLQKHAQYLLLILTLISGIYFIPEQLHADSCLWTGSSGNWEVTGNWNCGHIPNANDNVTINSNVTVSLNSATTINSLTLGNGTTTPILNFNYDAILHGALTIDDGDVIINANATITHASGTTNVTGRLNINVQTGSLTINTGGIISANAKGYIGTNVGRGVGNGPGAGAGSNNDAGGNGGGHGGYGKNEGSSSGGGGIYGSYLNPNTYGSSGGGGSNMCCGRITGSGGGVIQLNVGNTLTINGTLSANGGNANGRGGGGAGGSMNVSTYNLEGNPFISANGGNGVSNAGGGGGGRVSIKYSGTNTLAITNITANTGTGGNGGEPGTVLIKDVTNNDLYIVQSQIWRADPSFMGAVHNYRNVIIDNNSTWTLKGYFTNNSDGAGFSFNVNNFEVRTGSIINGNGQGYRGGYRNESGFGPGRSLHTGGQNGISGGAGYGGAGGTSSWGWAGGPTYATETQTSPFFLGSGAAGSGGSGGGGYGGSGGGALKVFASGDIVINGTINMNGTNGTTQATDRQGGGGSGGSVYLIGNNILGGGIITASGGNAGGTGAGNGGGGRISLEYLININWTGNELNPAIATPAGTGGLGGENGTVNINSITTGRITNLNAALHALKASDGQTDLTESVNAIRGRDKVLIKDVNGRPISEFFIFFNGDRNFSNIAAQSDSINGKAFFHVPGGFTNIPGYLDSDPTYTLYIPVSAGQNAVYVCPGASDMSEVFDGCDGGYELSASSSNVTTATIDSQTYFKVSGLTSTGVIAVYSNIGPTMRVDLANENTSASDDINIWFNTVNDLVSESLITIIYEEDFAGGDLITTSDVVVYCDLNGQIGDEVALTNAAVTNSDNGELTIDMNTDTCIDWVRVEINGNGGHHLTNPALPGNYSFTLATTIPDGEDTIIDSGATLAYIANANDVTVTTIVPPVLDMEIFEVNSSTLTNLCNLGRLSISSVSTCKYDIAAGTNNTSGLTIKITSDGGFDDGSGNIINEVIDGSVTAGYEEYGIQITDDGSSNQYDGGSYETGDRSIPESETTIAISSVPIDGIGNIIDRLEITHKVSIAVSTIAGHYNQVVTYTAYTN
jgi:hypothetical protein